MSQKRRSLKGKLEIPPIDFRPEFEPFAKAPTMTLPIHTVRPGRPGHQVRPGTSSKTKSRRRGTTKQRQRTCTRRCSKVQTK